MARSRYIVILVKSYKELELVCLAMPLMTSQILKYVDFTKTQKSRYLENKIHKLHIKGYFMAKNNFVVEVTFKFT